LPELAAVQADLYRVSIACDVEHHTVCQRGQMEAVAGSINDDRRADITALTILAAATLGAGVVGRDVAAGAATAAAAAADSSVAGAAAGGVGLFAVGVGCHHGISCTRGERCAAGSVQGLLPRGVRTVEGPGTVVEDESDRCVGRAATERRVVAGHSLGVECRTCSVLR
jgi:hypothetical protein